MGTNIMDWFLGETIMETDRGGGRWSVGEAQSGIIAGFVELIRGALSLSHEK